MPQVQRPTAAGVTTRGAAATPGDRGRSRPPLGRSAIAIGALVVAVAASVYVATAARDIVFGDSPELTAVAATLGVAHPPGYPLWTIVAHVFSLLPLGTLPFRVGLLSIVSGAACVGVVYAIALRLSHSVTASAAAALVLAVQPLFWSWSIVAEVFALNALLAAILVYCVLRWAERPAAGRWLSGAAFAGGLGLANQQTIVLLGPAVAYLLWRHRRAIAADTSMLARAAAAFLAGLVPYGYLPLAASGDPAWSFGDLSSAGDVLGHILRSQYGSGQLIVTPDLQGGPILDRLVALGSAFGALELTLGLFGLIELARRRAEPFRFFAIALALCGPFFAAYANADVRIPLTHAVLDRFFVLPLTIGAPLVAVGIHALPMWSPLRSSGRRRAELGLAVGGLAAVILMAGLTWTSIDRRADHHARDFAQDILASVPQNALVIVAGDAAAFPTQYLRTIEGARPDLSVVHQTYLPADWYVRQVRRRDATVALPYAAFDGPPATFSAFLAANGSRQIFLVGDLLDATTKGAFAAEPRGLTELVVQASAPPDPDTAARETERLFTAYHPADPAAVRGHAFEEIVLNDYGFALVRVGRELELAKRPADAKAWYERALRVVPGLADAKSGLARLR